MGHLSEVIRGLATLPISLRASPAPSLRIVEGAKLLMDMQQCGPEMQLRCDVNGNPISAKCSTCGAQMSQSSPRISNPLANVTWCGEQFRLHVANCHPPAAPLKS